VANKGTSPKARAIHTHRRREPRRVGDIHPHGCHFSHVRSLRGCCGMAGAFGYEREHHAVSVKCGERVLLPSVRKAGPDTLLIADGYSCREQIAQQTGRNAVHLTQVWTRHTGEDT